MVYFVNEDIFYNELKNSEILHYKSSSTNEIIKICCCKNNDVFVLNGQLNNKMIINNLRSIFIHDLKLFYKHFSKNGLKLNHNNFIDIKIVLNSIFNKNIELDDEIIEKITNIKVKNKFKNFITHNYKLDTVPNEICNIKNLEKSLIEEIILLNNIKDYINNNYKTNNFDRILHESSITYATIEENGIHIDINHVNYLYSDVKRYFVDYFENCTIAYVSYNLNKTTTGRLSSNFHTIPKKYEKCIKSRFGDKGRIVSVDFSNFEIKTLFKLFNIKNLDKDIYNTYSKELNKNRNDTKNSIITFLYGYKNKDKNLEQIKDLKELKYRILKYIKDVSFKIETNNGKIIKYETLEEAKERSINNICQNESTFLFLKFLNRLNETFLDKKLESKLIGTKYDSIILDCLMNEHQTISLGIKDALSVLDNDFVTYTIKCSNIGDN